MEVCCPGHLSCWGIYTGRKSIFLVFSFYQQRSVDACSCSVVVESNTFAIKPSFCISTNHYAVQNYYSTSLLNAVEKKERIMLVRARKLCYFTLTLIPTSHHHLPLCFVNILGVHLKVFIFLDQERYVEARHLFFPFFSRGRDGGVEIL